MPTPCPQSQCSACSNHRRCYAFALTLPDSLPAQILREFISIESSHTAVLHPALLDKAELKLTSQQAKAGGGKRGGSKLRPGGGGSLLSEPGFPGAVPGGEAERSAFWIVMEVRRDGAPGPAHGSGYPVAAAAAAAAVSKQTVHEAQRRLAYTFRVAKLMHVRAYSRHSARTVGSEVAASTYTADHSSLTGWHMDAQICMSAY